MASIPHLLSDRAAPLLRLCTRTWLPAAPPPTMCGMERVRGLRDAQRQLDELREQRPERPAPPPPVAAPTGAGAAGVVAGPADRVELDHAELAAVEAELARRHDELAELLRRAHELDGPLGDGRGPVAGHMRRAFGLRGGEEGVRAALRSYLAELTALREALHQVGATHRAVDEQAAAAMEGR